MFVSHLTTRLKRRGVNISGRSCLTSRGGSVNMTTVLKSLRTFSAGEASAWSSLRLLQVQCRLATNQPLGIITLLIHFLECEGERKWWRHTCPFLELFGCTNFYFFANVRKCKVCVFKHQVWYFLFFTELKMIYFKYTTKKLVFSWHSCR